MSKTVLFQTIPFSVSTVSMSKTILFQTIQFSISMQFSSICHIDRTLSGATTQSQSGVGSDENGVLRIPQSSSITGTSPSDCLASYPGQSLCVSSRCILQSQPNEQLDLIYIYIYIYILNDSPYG